MYWEFEKIWDNKYSYSMNEPGFYTEFEYDIETWCWGLLYIDDVRQPMVRDTFDIDFEEYFFN